MKELENNLFDSSKVSKKLVELEDRSLRNILQIVWLTENLNETWDDYDKKVQEVLRHKLNIHDDIESVTVWKNGEDLVNRQLSANLSVLKTGRRCQETKEPRNLYLWRILERYYGNEKISVERGF